MLNIIMDRVLVISNKDLETVKGKIEEFEISIISNINNDISNCTSFHITAKKEKVIKLLNWLEKEFDSVASMIE